MGRISVINPNSSESVTRSMEQCLTQLKTVTAHMISCTEIAASPPGIETDAHVAEVVPHVIRVVTEAERQGDADAFVLACFSDPGIGQVRSATRLPVIGIAEAAYLAALGLGDGFGVVSLGPSSIARHLRYLQALSIDGRLAGDRSIDMTVVEMMAGDVVETVVRTGKLLRDIDGASVVILGCAGLGGYREAVQAELGIPVIDPVQAAVALACSTLDLGYRRVAA